MSHNHVILRETDIVEPDDVVIKTGVFFESGNHITETLLKVIYAKDHYSGSSFKSTTKKFIVCAENGYGDGSYSVKKVRELAGGPDLCQSIVRIVPVVNFYVSKPKKLSSYSTQLPLP